MNEADRNIAQSAGDGIGDRAGGVPPDASMRERLRRAARDYVSRVRPAPPLPMRRLETHCHEILRQADAGEEYLGFAAVLANNEMWTDRLAAVPYDRRLLLLPQCLRDAGKCSATIDEYGLVCKHCGACSIGSLQREAERLGYVVLAAEGLPVVASLVQSGKIDALIGVCCLESLEKVFPFVEAAAIPALAMPLLCGGCKDTDLDIDWLWDAIYLSSDAGHRPLQIETQRRRVASWFTAESLADTLGSPDSETERIAHDWLAQEGKRWRPLLTVCTGEAFAGAASLADDLLRPAAIAVECFHKASLIHDDIEDHDPTRYGRQSLHERYGVPVALNVGDLLLGEGYRLLAGLDVAPEVRAEILAVAAEGHRTLCLGQGAELCWLRSGGPLSPEQVLEIFAHKTAPAFEVALRLGAMLAGADESAFAVLHAYSDALGVAYQIRDDLADLDGLGRDADAIRPSLLAALAWTKTNCDQQAVLSRLWENAGRDASGEQVSRVLTELDADLAARNMLETYRLRAVEALTPLEDVEPKALLRRVLAKIFNEFDAASRAER